MIRNIKNLNFFGIRQLIPYLKPYKKNIVIMFLLGIGISIVKTFIPIFQKYSLDHFVKNSNLDNIVYFILIYFTLIICSGVMNYLSTNLSFQIEILIKRDLRNIVFKHLQILSISYFNHNSVGYIHSRVMSDISNIGKMISWRIMDGIWQFTYLIASIIVMLSINIKITLFILLVIPIIIIFISIFQKKLLNINREIRKINSNITSNFNEEITGIKTIKTLNIENKMISSFIKDTQLMKEQMIKSSRIRGIFLGLLDFTPSLILAIILWKSNIIESNQIGTFSLFISYIQGIMNPLQWIIESVFELVPMKVNIERLISLLETEPDVKDSPTVIDKYGDIFSPKKLNWEVLKGDIEFRNVTFKYQDGEEYIFKNFNLKIPFGTNVAIVGETGAGKSTLVNLICRFFEPIEGEILIDGKNIKERSQLWLHSEIGYVLQTPYLFSGTIRENLLYGNSNASEEDIYNALEIVSARDFVENLENGLDTDVGECGDLLSSGEKQLISFARAIISNPKILILDEATASIDTITEQKIQNSINTVIKGRTSIIIAHRLSTIINSDIILVVRNGKIIECGNHNQLLANKGYYYELYVTQYKDEKTSLYLDI